MNTYIEYWLDNYPPSLKYPLDDPSSIANGASGRALIFLRMYYYTNNASYLNIANEYMANSLNYVDINDRKYSSFMLGLNGVYTAAIQVYNAMNNNEMVNEYIAKVTAIYDDVCDGIGGNIYSPKYNYSLNDGGFFTGLSGLLYNGMLLNKLIDGKEIISRECLSNISYYLIELGIETSKEYNTSYMLYECGFYANCFMIGSGDGVGGVMRQLFVSYLEGYLTNITQYYDYIKSTMDWLVSIQYSDGNMPTYNNITNGCVNHYGTDNNARVQWCHGGMSNLFKYNHISLY